MLAARKLLLSHRHRGFLRLGQQRNKPTRLLDVVHHAEKIAERVVRIVARALDDGVRKEQTDVSNYGDSALNSRFGSQRGSSIYV
ncbi:MAG: hypothetical protein ACHQK9_04565 [Reyranellales bacterium]